MLKCVLLALSTLTLAAQGAPPSQPAPAAKEAPVKVLNAPAPQGNPPGHPAEAPKVEPVPETQVIPASASAIRSTYESLSRCTGYSSCVSAVASGRATGCPEASTSR